METFAAMYGFKDLVDYLIDKKVDIAENILEYTLQFAVQRNLPRLYEYLQEKGLNIAKIKDSIPDLIHSAAASGSLEIMESFLDHGFDIMQKDKDGWTLLHYAASLASNFSNPVFITQAQCLNSCQWQVNRIKYSCAKPTL